MLIHMPLNLNGPTGDDPVPIFSWEPSEQDFAQVMLNQDTEFGILVAREGLHPWELKAILEHEEDVEDRADSVCLAWLAEYPGGSLVT